MPIDIKIEHDTITLGLNRLLQASNNLEPAMAAIAGVMADAAEQAFTDEANPATGHAWAPLSETTLNMAKRNKGGGHKILQHSGLLASSIVSEHGANFAAVGSNRVYAAMHQFGGTTSPNAMIPNKRIPARPFLGLSVQDEDEILAILSEHLQNALSDV